MDFIAQGVTLACLILVMFHIYLGKAVLIGWEGFGREVPSDEAESI